MRHRQKQFYITSQGKKIFVQLVYPKKIPAPTVIVAHGLRSYYPGFLNMFAKSLVQAGYIAVKFHFLGTGKSDGKFEEKSTAAMLKNFQDVVDFVANRGEVRDLGIMGRSNGGSLSIIHGVDKRIKAYVLLAPPLFYSTVMGRFVTSAKREGNFFVHPSFKRKHTKGPGRLPLDFVAEMKKAAAIVTEQGGITSHAAIVSRELGIPCVIGTKIATRVLRDGDRVEVDATRGIIKKL